jgi:hypothetical protein
MNVRADQGEALWWSSRTLPATPTAPSDLEALLALGKIHGMEPADLP